MSGQALEPPAGSRTLLLLVLAYTAWNFKVVSSLPRLLDLGRWWAPFVLPETLALVAALVLVWRQDGRLPGLPASRLFRGSLGLYLGGLVASTVANEVQAAFLVRVAVLQYAVPLMLFVLARRAVHSAGDAWRCVVALVAGGLLLYILATPVYFASFAAFPPDRPLPWPASRILYNRHALWWHHNDPRMLYDNVTFGNLLNVSQFLVTLLPLALAWLFVARSGRGRLLAGLAVGVFLLHLFFGYSKGGILIALAVQVLALVAFWRTRHPLRWVVAGCLAAFVTVTFAAPEVPRLWWRQLTFARGSSAWERLGLIRTPLHFEGYRPRLDPATVARLDGEPRWPAYAHMIAVGLGYGNYARWIAQPVGAGTHNLFLNALVNTGLLGLGGLVGLVAWGLGNLRRAMTPVAAGWRRPAAPLVAGVGAALVSVVAVGILSLYELEYLGTSAGASLLWFLLAMSAKLPAFAAGGVVGERA